MGYEGDYVFESKSTAPDTTTITQVGPKVTRGKLVRITSAHVVDYTTAAKGLVIGKRRPDGSDLYLRYVKLASTYEAYLTQPFFLIEAEAPIGIVESPTTSDVLYFSFYGECYKRVQ